jgi:hypothetical protein
MEALGAVGFVVLVLHVAAHVALAARLAKERKVRGLLAFFFPPLGVVWAREAGAHAFVYAYGGTLAAFAAIVTAIVLAR